ncbi:MAG: GUN4 domain-containing protein [Cyanobacteria bacterium P01_A01_bin.37]
MTSDSVTVFFSYSHKDEALRDELANHLSSLRNNGVIDAWHDRQILPGDEWDGAIKDSLNTAQIILLFISSDFISSRYCKDIEIKRAMNRHDAKDAVVIPVILRQCIWTDEPFSKLQALPKNGTPVISQTWHTPDEAFTDIANGIKKVANDIRQKIKTAKQAQLDQYEAVYTEAIKQAYPLSDNAQTRLKRLQDVLKLSDTDIAPIVTRLTAKYGEGKRKLEQYRSEVRECIEDEGEISGFSRSLLDTFRIQFGLTPEEAKAVEEEELHPYTAKQDAIAQYQKVRAQAKIPIDEKTRRRLNRLQRTLKLSDEDVQEIESADNSAEESQHVESEPLPTIGKASEATGSDEPKSPLNTHIARYRERVKEYLADRKLSPFEEIRLAQLRQELGLSEAEASAILVEEQAPFEQAKAIYRDALNRLIEAGHYPLGAETQQELRQLAQELQLTDSEREEIEQPILDAAFEDKLPSEKGIDYRRLRDLLKAQNFKDADQETYLRMLEAVGREDGNYFRPDDLRNFPCTDLKTIDRLWVKYSDGKFGFSVQKEIYVQCGAKLNGKYPGDKIFEEFCDRTGWRVNQQYIGLDRKTFSTSAPCGHLPSMQMSVAVCVGFGGVLVGGLVWGFLFSHRDL